ncbi:large conductance mechanosensitive channel protein MscL [Companilactobacillus mishanensis]|uniref:Large-conductance mechanosensitive channel n=1 Tax=Companilactobacillus mishanensis TaxID=2486008 RepID=A0A5P0ZH18_9LACO|nr:large conductance mechanosensitive channel protein MscL [Companilactobacillus mishanensis]MQS44970.1 large conductance mechanosensitive channel protein MscL [Companilactobacillus mishanensis]MQS52351.1 large conductance mechanosensitive channel protein MscL [Companilactobacillus mishanensis]MQS89485.1 large conductance mechanosensitive channel protein MscL [Companilactobacillus mishanensis]
MLKEFQEFISRGSVVDLAVGVIIGAAFNSLVSALTTYILNPLIGLIIGRIDLTDMKFTAWGATFLIGDFINAIINFLIIMFVIFIIVRLMNKMRRDGTRSKFDNVEETDPQLEYLQQIRDLMRYQAQQQQNNNRNNQNNR